MNQKRENFDLILKILNVLGFHVSTKTQKIILNKDYGIFEIDLVSRDVSFTANLCLKCDIICGSKRQKICIINADTKHIGWSNIPLNHEDLLLLSKIIALKAENLPKQVANQVHKYEICSPSEDLHQTLMYELHLYFESKKRAENDTMLQMDLIYNQ